MSNDRSLIEATIERAYIDGIHRKPDLDVVLSGFHPEFRMLVPQDGRLEEVSPEAFVNLATSKREAHPEAFADPIEHAIPLVEITGDVAIARVDLFRSGRLLYTDYLSLYRSNGRWQIVAKVFHNHFA